VPARVDIVVVDDHPMWRQTLRQVVDGSRGYRVVGEASDGEEAVAIAISTQPAVIIMDLNLPEVDGAEATRRVVDAVPQVKVLVLSASDAPSQVVAAVRAGASGYLLKTAQPSEVLDALDRVHRGEMVVPSEVSDAVLTELRRGAGGASRIDPLDTLTPREREVLGLMAEGRSNQAICEQLHVSTRAVEGHVRNIFMKLGLEPTPDDHRRVLAVLAHLRRTSS
jgi:DNA-binding NarL/FixJ family response regulator